MAEKGSPLQSKKKSGNKIGVLPKEDDPMLNIMPPQKCLKKTKRDSTVGSPKALKEMAAIIDKVYKATRNITRKGVIVDTWQRPIILKELNGYNVEVFDNIYREVHIVNIIRHEIGWDTALNVEAIVTIKRPYYIAYKLCKCGSLLEYFKANSTIDFSTKSAFVSCTWAVICFAVAPTMDKFGVSDDKDGSVGIEQFLKTNFRHLLKMKRRAFVIWLVIVTGSVFALIWSALMIVSTIREFGTCVEEGWTRETCEKISCSAQGSLVITKIRRCEGNKIERITKNCIMLSKCFPTWTSKEVNCSLTRNGKQVKMLLMNPNMIRNDAIVAFADSKC